MTRTQIFADWQAGSISDREALRALLSDLGEVESQITPLEAERADLRTQISEVLASLGGRADADGYKLNLTAPGVAVRYDAKELDQLVSYLQASGDDRLANLILAARKESARSGQLRIVPPKATSEK